MKRKLSVLALIIIMALMTGCAQTQKPALDQAIQYRAIFNNTLGSFNTNLAALPTTSQAKYAKAALPFVKSGQLALDTMDAMVVGGGTVTPETLQQYLAAKNALIDMIAQMVIEQKGVK